MDATNNNRPEAGEAPDAPPRLLAAFKQLQSQRVFVPPSVDEIVLRAARKHLAEPKKRGMRLVRHWLFWPAFATACVCLALLAHTFLNPGRQKFAREDVNHDGHVDILDAFALARQVESGHAASALDLNADGVVDRRDAEVIATRAVKLEKGGRS